MRQEFESPYNNFERPKGNLSESSFIAQVMRIIEIPLRKKFIAQGHNDDLASDFALSIGGLLWKAAKLKLNVLGSEKDIRLDHANDLSGKYPDEFKVFVWIEEQKRERMNYESIMTFLPKKLKEHLPEIKVAG